MIGHGSDGATALFDMAGFVVREHVILAVATSRARGQSSSELNACVDPRRREPLPEQGFTRT